MSGHTKWSEIRLKKPVDEAALAQHLAEARVEQERYRRTLAQLRKARALTQVDVARQMGTAQGEVSKLERRADAYLSTLQEYVAACGGRLRLVAEFDDGECDIELSMLSAEEGETSPAESESVAA